MIYVYTHSEMITIVELTNISSLIVTFSLCVWEEHLIFTLLAYFQYSIQLLTVLIMPVVDLLILQNCNFVPFDQYLPIFPSQW